MTMEREVDMFGKTWLPICTKDEALCLGNHRRDNRLFKVHQTWESMNIPGSTNLKALPGFQVRRLRPEDRGPNDNYIPGLSEYVKGY